MAVIFPDIESVLVSFFRNALTTLGGPLATGVVVATKKVAPDLTQPAKQVVIKAAYNAERNYVTKVASVTIDVYADDEMIASELALLIEAMSRMSIGDEIKKAEVLLGPVRTSEETEQERRSLDIELIVSGSEVAL